MHSPALRAAGVTTSRAGLLGAHQSSCRCMQHSAAAGASPASAAATSPAAASMSPAAASRPPIPDLGTIKGVLFDIDGTLTNSDPLHLRAFQEVLAEAGFNGGVPISEAFFRAHISGRHNPEIAADLFPEWSEERRVAFYTDKEQRFRDNAATKLSRMPGLSEFLGWLDARGLRRAAVTNAPRDNTTMMLAALRLDGAFEGVVLGEECARAKPHPDPYLEGLRLLGLQPHEAIVVEDSPAGVRAARAAGLPVFGITSGQEEAVLWEAGCCMLMQDFHQLLELAQSQCRAAANSGNGSSNGATQQQQQQQQAAAAAAGANGGSSPKQQQPQQAGSISITADSRGGN